MQLLTQRGMFMVEMVMLQLYVVYFNLCLGAAPLSPVRNQSKMPQNGGISLG